jgi:hypothetical protein
MNSSEIRIEISKLEDEAKQILAKANFIAGAVKAYHAVLAKVMTKEQAEIVIVKNDIAKDLTAEANKLEPPKA